MRRTAAEFNLATGIWTARLLRYLIKFEHEVTTPSSETVKETPLS